MTTNTSAGQIEAINDMEMFYRIHGQGEPLVLLHGFTGSGEDWESFTSELSINHKLIIPDLRGHGRSTNPSKEFTFRQSAFDVFALLDRLGIEKFKAIGVSGGAKTLLHMSTGQPDRIESQVLVSAAPYFPAQARAIMATFTAENRSEEEWAFFRERHKYGDEQILALLAQGSGFKDSFDDMNFTPPYLSTIRARTLIVHGDRDPFYPVSLAIEMYSAIPRSYLWIIPNGGHGPIFGEQTRSFINTASAFLQGEWEV